MANGSQDAYCTLLTSDNYLPGALVLAHSLRDNGTKRQIVCLVTLDSLSVSTLNELRKLYDQLIPVERIINQAPANLLLMDRPDLASSFTKINLWRQTQFRRIVYIDADVVALRAPDELFHLESSFAAAPDIGWPDCFNSGVLALAPNMGDYYALKALADRGISFDGADQGLLNMHFRNWDKLSFTYNCTPSGSYQYVPAYRHFQSTINLVHFIGHDKPWTMGKSSKGGGGVYDELLARWWAVYERHFRVPAPERRTGNPPPAPRVVSQYVKGEDPIPVYNFSSNRSTYEPLEQPLSAQSWSNVPRQISMQALIQPSEGQGVLAPTTEMPLTERPEGRAEVLEQGDITPVPTLEQRRFSAPLTEWDPLHQEPPKESRPEAANFPSQTYTMSVDKKLFQPPKSYPEPPKGMYYEIPPTPVLTEKPKLLFPWEENQAKPTRVFADDKPLVEITPSLTTDDLHVEEREASPTTPNPQVTTEPFAFYSRTNAWDEVPEIERYISALTQNRRAKVQVLSDTTANGQILSPDAESPAQRRKPSMKLTDFPTEIERPSLPVTPAPRHPSFWGEERDAAGELPSAEGVPTQTEWDPVAKLEELQRRQSEVIGLGPTTATRSVPERDLPESATLLPTSEETIVPQTSVMEHQHQELDFTGKSFERSGEDEGVFSPIE